MLQVHSTVAKHCESDACLIVREALESPPPHSFLELLKFRLHAGTYRPADERWFMPTGRLMTFITSCPHSRAAAFLSAKSSISAYQMGVMVFLLLLDVCSSPGSALIPGSDCNSPSYSFSRTPQVTAGAPGEHIPSFAFWFSNLGHKWQKLERSCRASGAGRSIGHPAALISFQRNTGGACPTNMICCIQMSPVIYS